MANEKQTPEITAEMIAAGLSVFDDLSETCPGFLLVPEIYKAMWAESRPIEQIIACSKIKTAQEVASSLRLQFHTSPK